MAAERRVIAVIGAGVIGLQTSISLAEAGYRVLIIAKHVPGDESIEYTSPWAGAHWRSHASDSDHNQKQWDTETYHHWLEVIKSESENSNQIPSGLGLYHSRFYSTTPEDPWFADTVLDYRTISTDSMKEGIKHGHEYTSVMINVPIYLSYLQETAKSLGVTIIQATLPTCSNYSETLQAAARILKPHLDAGSESEISAFVNATGISACKLVPDTDVHPIRGQTVTVVGEAKQITTVHDLPRDAMLCSTYILPRPHSNTTILGGTKQVGNWTAESDSHTTEEILRRAKEWAPELLNEKGEFDVLSVQVGLRPGRKGGARVEAEIMDGFLVCHAYGHAGAGYQNSLGSAKKVVKLLNEHLFHVQQERLEPKA